MNKISYVSDIIFAIVNDRKTFRSLINLIDIFIITFPIRR